MAWNYGDILETLESVLPPDSRPSSMASEPSRGARRDGRPTTWRTVARGARPGDKLAIYMRNRPEYLMALAAAFKARLTHVNVNYRYTPEVWYIFDNSDSRPDGGLCDRVRAVAEFARGCQGEDLVEVGEDRRLPDRSRPSPPRNGGPLAIERSGDDQFFIYTGGTTGMPKGVMSGPRRLTLQTSGAGLPVQGDAGRTGRPPRRRGDRSTLSASPPLMHGTGLLTAMGAMLAGGSVVTLEARVSIPKSCSPPSTATSRSSWPLSATASPVRSSMRSTPIRKI